MNYVTIDGVEYHREGALTVPQVLPGTKPTDPVPETRVTLSMKIEGGGIPEGETVNINLAPLTLTKPGQLKLDLLTEEPELDSFSGDSAQRPPRQLVQLSLDPTRVTEDHVYVITYPEGMTRL